MSSFANASLRPGSLSAGRTARSRVVKQLAAGSEKAAPEFMDYDLGYFDLENRVLEPLENPFGPKLSTM